jgi:hypothetical protein
VTTSVATVRQAIATTLDAVAGWRELAKPYDLVVDDPTSWLHQGFAVGAPWTEDVSAKQRATTDEEYSELRVFWAWKVQVGSGPIESYDAALAAEQLLYAAIAGIRRGTSWRLILGRRSRTCTDTWVHGEIIIEAHHQTR